MVEEEKVTEEQQADIVYFVAYYSSKGMGNTEAVISGYIIGTEQVQEIERLIEEQEELRDVKIINFFPIREELPQEQGE